METTKVLRCAAEEYAYNKDKACHALAITIGSPHQMCDTYIEDPQKGGVSDAQARVGACHMRTCRYNLKLECAAPVCRRNSRSSSRLRFPNTPQNVVRRMRNANSIRWRINTTT